MFFERAGSGTELDELFVHSVYGGAAVFGGLRQGSNRAGNLGHAISGFRNRARHFIGGCGLFLYRRRDSGLVVVDRGNNVGDFTYRGDGFFDIGLNLGDFIADFTSGVSGIRG